MNFKFPYYISVEQTDAPITSTSGDSFFPVLPSDTADLPMIIDEMVKEMPDIPRETVELVLRVERNALKRLLLSGWRINNKLFEAIVQSRELTYNGRRNPQNNSLYVNFQQGKELRDALKELEVVVVRKQQKPFYINGSKDSVTGRTDFVATPGEYFTLFGKNVKLAGEHLAVGITITNEEELFKISEEDIIVNHPSKLIFLIPKDMSEGEYELTVTTQYGSGGRLLKAPRSVSQYIRIENQKS